MGEVIAFGGPRGGPRFKVMIFEHNGEWGWRLEFLPAGKVLWRPGYSTLAAARRGCWRALQSCGGRDPLQRRA
jgi:hypothetical protein